MIIDFHNHIGRKKDISFTAEELIEKMNSSKVDKAVVFSFPENINNEYVAESCKKYPNRLIGFACINPWKDNAEEELEYSINTLGLKGLKLHSIKHGFAFDNHLILDPLFKIAEKYSIPIIAYGAANALSSPNMFEEMARTFPKVNLVIGHSGQMYEAKAAIGASKRNPNLYLETSTVFAVNIKKQLKDCGCEKILLGTDMPWGDYDLEIKKIIGETQDANEVEAILSGNALRLLGGAGV